MSNYVVAMKTNRQLAVSTKEDVKNYIGILTRRIEGKMKVRKQIQRSINRSVRELSRLTIRLKELEEPECMVK